MVPPRKSRRRFGIVAVAVIAMSVMPLTAATAEKIADGPEPGDRTFESAISPADVRPHVEFLAGPALRGRSGADARRAAEYIRDRFRESGLEPLFEDDWFQPIPTRGPDGERRIGGYNVGGWIPGSDPERASEFIIVSAHHDHLGVRGGRAYRGADDNATGVAMMLEVAKQLGRMKEKPRRSVVFIGFDLEEQLLRGSRWFADHPPWPLERVTLFITADMIGRSLGNLPLSTVFLLGSEHAPNLKSMLDAVGRPSGLEIPRLGIDLIGTRSDYAPFRDRNVPFLFFSSGEHPDYHTVNDVPERIEYDKVARVSGLVLEIVRHVGDEWARPAWTDRIRGDLDEARAVHRVSTLLLDAGDQRPLTDVQRLLVTHAHQRSRQILKRGRMTDDERAWLVRVTQLMLFSLF